MRRSLPPLLRTTIVAAGATALLLGFAQEERGERFLDESMHHLGNDETPKWTEAPPKPEPSPLVVRFESRANASEWTLEVSARDVDDDWAIALNGRRLGLLRRINEEIGLTRFIVPAGALLAGRNELTVTGRNPDEDITVGRFKLIERSLHELLGLGRLEIAVADAADGSPLPARVTVAGEDGKLAELHYAQGPSTAVRAGIAYTKDGRVAIELLPGRYTVWASRGMEWSCAQREVTVASGSKEAIAFALAREVDTTGWIAADTHVHTLTHSGHGDSNVEERVITLAGEGVELAVATDHNHQTDYRPQQRELGLTRWFTPVVGNEVTSENGHMNAFPLPPGTDVPQWKERDWSKLVASIRAKGAQVVILNHPRWPEKGKDPLTVFGFDDLSGGRKEPQRFTFDAIELVNSDAPTQPAAMVLPAWYGLLNRGEVLTGVGASDSHHVGVIVGQGRTYVPSTTDDPAAIDVDAACRAFLERRVTVSLGMLATIEIAGGGMGDVVRVAAADESAATAVEAQVTVRHPTWVTPERLDLIVNGSVAASVPLARQDGDAPTRLVRRVRVPLCVHDAWVVAIVTGAKVTAPFWAMSQPAALAVTNPVFLDRDDRSGWQSPRATAERLLKLEGADNPEMATLALVSALDMVDDGVAIQLLDLARDRSHGLPPEQLETIAASIGVERTALRGWARSQGLVP